MMARGCILTQVLGYLRITFVNGKPKARFCKLTVCIFWVCQYIPMAVAVTFRNAYLYTV